MLVIRDVCPKAERATESAELGWGKASRRKSENGAEEDRFRARPSRRVRNTNVSANLTGKEQIQ